MRNCKLSVKISLLSILILSFVTLNLISCNNSIQEKNESKASKNHKAYINISLNQPKENQSRTVLPDSDINKLTDICLSGSTSGQPSYTKTFTSVADLQANPIEFEDGEWTLYLTAKFNGVSFTSQHETINVELGKFYNIAFTLSNSETNGKLKFKLSFTGDSDEVTYEFQQYPPSDPPLVGQLTINSGTEKYIEYNNDSIAPGSYRLILKFYRSNVVNPANTQNILVNTYSEIISIKAGFTSQAERSINVNDLYTITYNYDNTTCTLVSGDTLPEKYSIYSTPVTLGKLEKTGYDFKGWYTAEGGTGTKIESIPDLSPATRTLYAYFTLHEYQIWYYEITDATYPEGPNPETYTIEDEFTFKPVAKEHYTFKGWYTGRQGLSSAQQITGISIGSTGLRSYYAHWEPNPTIEITPGFPKNYVVNWRMIKTSAGKKIEIIIKEKNGNDVTPDTFKVSLYIDGTKITDYTDTTFTYPNFLPDPIDSSFYVEFTIKANETTTYFYDYYPQRIYLGSKAPNVAKEVGDIVFNDGSAEPYVDGMTFTTDQKNTVAAIVFYTGDDTDIGNRVLVAALDSTSKSLIKNNTNIINTFDNFIFDSHNGKLSMAEVKASAEWSDATNNYPGFYSADIYDVEINDKSEWYIPADSELKKLLSIKDTISAACTALGKNTIIQNGMYFSSTKSPGMSGMVKTYQKSLTPYITQASSSNIICFIQEL